MASKKLKKALMAGVVGALGARALGQAGEMKEFLKTEGGDKAKINYITKKAKPNTFMGKVKKAVNVYKTKGLNTGRGPGIKATDTLAGMGKGDAFDYFNLDMKSKGGQMVKARGGKLVNLKPTKMS
tara:strand:+ start:787 stop:1164 length:378 start_codon:yes stop_codon:yes gene_type:complete